MPRPLQPPRGLFIGTYWLFDPGLSPNVKETLLQLMVFAWGSSGCTTPPLSYAQLEHLTGKDARTLRGHLAALRTYQAVLSLQPAGVGQFIVNLAGWLFRNNPETTPPAPAAEDAPTAARSPAGKFLPQPDQIDLNQDQYQEEEKDIKAFPLLLNDQQPAPKVKTGAPKVKTGAAKAAAEKPAAQNAPAGVKKAKKKNPLSGELQIRLREAGVFPTLLEEISARAQEGRYSEKDLASLLEWCQDDQPENAARLFVGRLRAGARAPGLYDTPACHNCGKRGKHADNCYMRYAIE